MDNGTGLRSFLVLSFQEDHDVARLRVNFVHGIFLGTLLLVLVSNVISKYNCIIISGVVNLVMKRKGYTHACIL